MVTMGAQTGLLGKIPGGLFGVEYLPITLPPLPARWHIRFASPISMEGAPAEPRRNGRPELDDDRAGPPHDLPA